jgi:hypothetical protein
MIMKRLGMYCYLALAACLSCFSMSVSAMSSLGGHQVARAAFPDREPHGVAFQRLQLTLAQWRNQAQAAADTARSDMRKSGHGLVFKGVGGPLPAVGELLAV